MNWPEPEGKKTAISFYSLPMCQVPQCWSSTSLQAEIHMRGDCTNQWELLLGKRPPFGPFIFSFKLLLLSYVFNVENLDI